VFRGSVKGTGYPLLRQFPLHFPSSASPCAITFQLVSTTWTPFNFRQLLFSERSPISQVKSSNVSVDLRKTNLIRKNYHHSALRPYASRNVLLTQTHVHSDRISRLLETNAVLKNYDCQLVVPGNLISPALNCEPLSHINGSFKSPTP